MAKRKKRKSYKMTHLKKVHTPRKYRQNPRRKNFFENLMPENAQEFVTQIGGFYATNILANTILAQLMTAIPLPAMLKQYGGKIVALVIFAILSQARGFERIGKGLKEGAWFNLVVSAVQQAAVKAGMTTQFGKMLTIGQDDLENANDILSGDEDIEELLETVSGTGQDKDEDIIEEPMMVEQDEDEDEYTDPVETGMMIEDDDYTPAIETGDMIEDDEYTDAIETGHHKRNMVA